MLTCRKGQKLENNIPFTDNQNSGWPVVSNLPLAPSPRMLTLWHAALVRKQPSEKQEWHEHHSSLGGCNRTTLPPKSAAACRLVLRMYSLGSARTRPGQVRGSQSGTLLWKVSVSTVHCDRKRWLMSLRLFPAVKRHPGMLKWPLWSLPVLGGRRWELLVGFLKPRDQLRVSVTGTPVQNNRRGLLPPRLLPRNGK